MDIKGYEGLYSITKSGKVYSHITNKFLAERINRDGYVYISLYKNKIQHNAKMHRLVVEHFIPNDIEKLVVNHKDGNKTNNHVDNLEWCTKSYNLKHAYDNGLRIPSNQHNVLVYKNSVLIGNYVSIHECARQLDILTSSIRKVITGKHSQTHGYVIKRVI